VPLACGVEVTAAGNLGCRCSKKWAAFQHLRQKVCLDGPGMPVGKLHAIQMVDTMIGGIWQMTTDESA
jgi:hypothetical protein